MIETFRIGTSKHIVPIYERLKKDASELNERGILIKLLQGEDGEYQLLDCELTIDENGLASIEDGFSICCHQIADAVAEAIVIWWKPELMQAIISEKYQNLSHSESSQIVRKLHLREQPLYIQSVATTLTWKKEIASRIVDFLEAGNMVTVDGFINFRLHDFKLELEQLIDEAVEEYLMEKEYDDFIDLLRYFVNTQEPRLDKVHVLLLPSGAFNMYDKNYRLIDKDFLEGFILDLMENDLSYEDLLVSALITIAPTEIILHLPGSIGEMSSAVNTIQSVFSERVAICIGCSRCRSSNLKNPEMTN